jgi:hypothetical protein
MPNFPLPVNHHAETLAAHSPAVVLGRPCAVTGEVLRPGDDVVVCDAAPDRDPITVAGWATLGSCPHCGAGTGLAAAYVPPAWGAPPAPPIRPAPAAPPVRPAPTTPPVERERSPALVGGLIGLFLLAALAIAVAAFLFVLRTRDGEPAPLPVAGLTATAGAATAGPTADGRPPTAATATPLVIAVQPSATAMAATATAATPTPAAPTPTLMPTATPVPSPTPNSPTTALLLIDPGDGGTIRALRAEDTIDLNDLDRDTFNVLADVDSSLVESVIFLLDGAPFCPRDNCVENAAPYYMGGDSSGRPYDDWDWSEMEMLGTHTLTAIPCSGDGGTGDCFTPIEVRLTIVR